MKTFKNIFFRSASLFFLFTILCGLVYTCIVTGIAQLLFPTQANGSLTKQNQTLVCELIGQQYTNESHMWGRIMNLDVTTYKDEQGNPLLYASPSNLSPADKKYELLVKNRIHKLKEANPSMQDTPIPVDLVTCSGSGLDPAISVAAAQYQVERLANANNVSEEIIKEIIDDCTTDKFLGIFGEKTVNVVKVNVMLDEISQ